MIYQFLGDASGAASSAGGSTCSAAASAASCTSFCPGRDHGGVPVGAVRAVGVISVAIPFANVLKHARIGAAAQNVIPHRQGEVLAGNTRRPESAHMDVGL